MLVSDFQHWLGMWGGPIVVTRSCLTAMAIGYAHDKGDQGIQTESPEDAQALKPMRVVGTKFGWSYEQGEVTHAM